MTTDDNMGIDSLTVDAVRERNDNVDERIEKLKEKVRKKENDSEALESIREELNIDADESVTSAVKMLQDHAQELREDKRTSMKNTITNRSEYTHNDLADHDIDELELVIDGLNHVSDDADSDGDESTLKTATNDAADDQSAKSRVRGRERVDPRAFQ